MIREIAVTDLQGERFKAEMEIYRVVMTGHIHMRISRYNHVDHKGKESKRPSVHMVLNKEEITAILEDVGKIL